MATYLLRADQCPPLQVASAVLNPAATTPVPTMATVLPSGMVPDHISRWGANAVRIDAIGRHGGGGIAVVSGFDVSVAGLVLTVNPAAPGEYRFDSILYAAGPLVLPGGLADGGGSTLYNYVWYSMQGNLARTTSSNADAPAAPPASGGGVGPWGYVCRVATAGGTATDGPDFSGRPESRSGRLYRRTADIGPPLDSPPAALNIETQTRSGRYLWDGAAHRELSSTRRKTTLSAGEALYIPAGEQEVYVGDLDWSAGDVSILGNIFQLAEAA